MTKQELLGRWWYRLLQVLFVIALVVTEAYISVQGPPWFTITGTLHYDQRQWVERLGADARSKGESEGEVKRLIEKVTSDYQGINYMGLAGVAASMVFVFFAFILLKRIFLYVAIAQPIVRWPRRVTTPSTK